MKEYKENIEKKYIKKMKDKKLKDEKMQKLQKAFITESEYNYLKGKEELKKDIKKKILSFIDKEIKKNENISHNQKLNYRDYLEMKENNDFLSLCDKNRFYNKFIDNYSYRDNSNETNQQINKIYEIQKKIKKNMILSKNYEKQIKENKMLKNINFDKVLSINEIIDDVILDEKNENIKNNKVMNDLLKKYIENKTHSPNEKKLVKNLNINNSS